jgi:adenosylmethionine-8-amino-7-oxononanoate aminotransferase
VSASASASHVFYRKLNRAYPTVVAGEGCWLVDADGRRYLDGSSGAFVAGIGHGVREVAEAMARQAAQVSYVSGMAFTHEAGERLAAEIAQRSPAGLDRVYFLSSGSDAIEAALKLARQYWVEAGRATKHKIIALTPSYHGNTIFALSASARALSKTYYGDWLIDVRTIPAPYAYRCPCRGADPACPRCRGLLLEEAILAEGPETVAAFVAEPVGGSSTGAAVPRLEYFRTIRETCDRHDVLFIADEIITGVGRTGTWSALEPTGVAPDIMVLGKGLAGGAAALSAVVAPSRIVDVLAQGSGALLHGQTFSHHPVACAAGLATIQYLTRCDLVARAARMGEVLHRRLAALRELPHVGDVRGRGLLAGIELVADAETRAPFARERRVAERVADAAFAAGLVVWPNGGQAADGKGDVIMIAPPYVIDEGEIEELGARLEGAIRSTLS